WWDARVVAGATSDSASSESSVLPTPPADLACGPDIWHAVPLGAPCGFFEADLSRWCVPKRMWTSCGPGCTTANASQYPNSRAVYSGASAASYLDGDLYVRPN